MSSVNRLSCSAILNTPPHMILGNRIPTMFFLSLGSGTRSWRVVPGCKGAVQKSLQPLVVRQRIVLLVRDGRMRQCEPKQGFVAELMAEAGLEFGEGGHGLLWEH